MSERAKTADRPSVAGVAVAEAAPTPEGSHVDLQGRRYYRIVNYDAMPPFFMSLVSGSDHWLFLSSNGALTAGRKNPDHALFPYTTDDRIHDSQDQVGSKTLLLVTRGGQTFLWEPFSSRYEGLYRLSRSLYKSVVGNEIIFEEHNADLALTFSYAWTTSARLGFVRRATLANEDVAVSVDVLDGIQNVLPAGLTRRFQAEYSTLADGYKESELDAETGLALFRLSSIPTDRAEPSEALRATTVWSHGLTPTARLLCADQLGRFRHGQSVQEETAVRGRRGAYFVAARLGLRACGREEWYLVADVDQDASDVVATGERLRAGRDLRAEIEEDVERGTRDLVRLVASADGLQLTGDELSTWRHFSNTLFNVMRGGIPDRGYTISRADLRSFLERVNRRVAQSHAALIGALPEAFLHGRLLALAREQKDPDLERLAYEYLPLTFSRRHGDPSRPWNEFSIEVEDEQGAKILNYQGNWRDIFQNWEALALSFPGFVESMIFKFVDASTADGFNPYRVTRDGYDWEVIDPHDPWSYIGYWGDHQVIYLLKLLEISEHYHPEALACLLTRGVFTYANVPYRIRPYARLLDDPRNTIEFDASLDRTIRTRVAALGADGKCLTTSHGELCRANLTEKLLVLVLAKLAHYVPEAGIWMNTQRPEWNDANNALVGYGVSMVTLYYLRRFLSFCRELFGKANTPAAPVAAEVARLFRSVDGALAQNEGLLAGPISDRDRKVVLDALGQAGGDYRAGLYANGFSGDHADLGFEELRRFCDRALRHVDHSIRANRREDGLYHAYNLMRVVDGRAIAIRHLYEMLEGQVAVLSSGALSPGESADLLDTLRASRLYRTDQSSYLLYPDRRLPRFLEKNDIPPALLARSPLLAEMVQRGDRRLVSRDERGGVHFHAAFRNGARLRQALAAIADGESRARVEGETAAILEIYEDLFDHQSFTGRSGTFYKYEGLGCVYWHMVSKLALAVAEVALGAARAGESEALVARLRAHYRAIREGIGVHKPPHVYGAVPTDPYSHTPGFGGVQQPGMTGQVKEDVIARFAEMGAFVENGRLSFQAHLLGAGEFLGAPQSFRFYDADGEQQVLRLPRGTLAFTLCQVPVVVSGPGPMRVEILRRGGAREAVSGLHLDAPTSAAVFERTGEVRRLDVHLGLAEPSAIALP